MRRGEPERGVFRIKNESGGPIAIQEIGGAVLSNGGEIDLMDPELPIHYKQHSQIMWAATKGNTQLRADIDAGKLTIQESKPEIAE